MIRVLNWEKYQSYKDRRPPWIRFHKTMLDNYEFQGMSSHARALLPMLWLLASENPDPVSGLIQDSYEKITFRLRMDQNEFTSAMAEIENANFIEVVKPIETKGCIETVTKPYQICNETVTPETETETETEAEAEAERGSPPKKSKLRYQDFMEYWNNTMAQTPIPKIKDMTEKRKRQVKTVVKDIETFKAMCSMVLQSEFLTGRNKRGWVATLDFCLNKDKFTKIMEGGYATRKSINNEYTEADKNQIRGFVRADLKNDR